MLHAIFRSVRKLLMALVYAALALADVAADAMEQRRSLLGDTGRTGPNGYALQVGLSAGYSHTCGLDTAGAACGQLGSS